MQQQVFDFCSVLHSFLRTVEGRDWTSTLAAAMSSTASQHGEHAGLNMQSTTSKTSEAIEGTELEPLMPVESDSARAPPAAAASSSAGTGWHNLQRWWQSGKSYLCCARVYRDKPTTEIHRAVKSSEMNLKLNISLKTLAGYLPTIELKHDATVRDLADTVLSADPDTHRNCRPVFIRAHADGSSEELEDESRRLSSFGLQCGVVEEELVLMFEDLSDLSQRMTVMLSSADTKAAAKLLQRGDRYLTTLSIPASCPWSGLFGKNVCHQFTAAISSMVSITYLNLSQNQIDCKGCKIIARALSNCKSLQHLDLRMNQIGDAGCCTLAAALTDAKKLTQLDLSINKIGEIGCLALAGVLKFFESLNGLDLSYNSFGDHGCRNLISTLPSLSNLTNLGLMGNSFGDEACKALATESVLTMPVLGKLHSLKLDYCKTGFSELSKAMSSLHSLTCVEIRADSARIQNIDDVCKLTSALLNLHALHALDLSGVHLDDQKVGALEPAFAKHKWLKILKLNNVCGNGDGGCHELAKLLPTLKYLETLELNDNFKFGASGCNQLMQALQHLKCLRILELNNNSIGSHAETCSSLVLVLRNMKSLQVLGFNSNLFGAGGCRVLAPALSKLESLITLRMNWNRIDAEGCRVLAPALTTMKSLRVLNFSENLLDVEACRILATALPSLESLKYLCLFNRHNPITKEGCRVLTLAFMKLSTLVVMDPHDFAGNVGCRTCKHVFANSNEM